MIPRAFRLLLIILLAAIYTHGAEPAPYDPLAPPTVTAPEPFDLTVHDAARKRDIPIRVFLPVDATPAPVVLFSHGLGGSREGCPYLGQHWRARGYAVVYTQHPGSDDSIWRDAPLAGRMDAMRNAAGLDNYMLRVKDISAVIDQLTQWNAPGGHPLAGRLDLTRIGMSGHSFGAMTTQAVSGQTIARSGVSFTDPRIKAAIMFSPSAPRISKPERAFGAVAIPWMVMTGTKDISIIGGADLESRLAVYPPLPPGGKYELVLYNAEHSAFSDRALPGDSESRNPNHHRAILALSTAFWDAWLRGEPEAKVWLDGGGPATILENADRWRRK